MNKHYRTVSRSSTDQEKWMNKTRWKAFMRTPAKVGIKSDSPVHEIRQ